MASVYSEVTAESASGFTRDRLLEKLYDADQDLPYSLDDIVISHNDFAISDVINDSIKKLYDNYLFLIANAEINTKTCPASADLGFISFDYYDLHKFCLKFEYLTNFVFFIFYCLFFKYVLVHS